MTLMGIAMVKQIPTLRSSAHNYGEMYGMVCYAMVWYVCMQVGRYVCIFVCVYVFVYVYTHVQLQLYMCIVVCV